MSRPKLILRDYIGLYCTFRTRSHTRCMKYCLPPGILLLVIIAWSRTAYYSSRYCTLPCRTSSSNMPTVQYSTVRYSYSMCSDGGSTGGCPPWLNENIGGSKGGFPPWLNENMGGSTGGFPPWLNSRTACYCTVQYCTVLPTVSRGAVRPYLLFPRFREISYCTVI